MYKRQDLPIAFAPSHVVKPLAQVLSEAGKNQFHCAESEKDVYKRQELWTQYMLPEYDPNMIFANAPKLTRLWRDHDGRRVARPDAVATIKELHRRGYTPVSDTHLHGG